MTERSEEETAAADVGADSRRPASFWAGSGPRSLALATAMLIGGTAAIVALHGNASEAPRYRAVDVTGSEQQASADPLMAELIRCRALPPQASDPSCQRAWDENRQRFFGEARATPFPGNPLPGFAPIPAPPPANASTLFATAPASPVTEDH
ncbi:putative entry exclusion protein TrbK-alt [Sphingomonas sp. PAMC 26617]|uniref:putative entry exclusion protein TrbK-alt n=1 Tax=Sphingomonas sp. PAMC 26617 TaxID=1112216 RepID=UPI0002884661|nr:putative entry exclusion protein TrbK-alt [Sphingomonas sp. PAMC 26617]